MSNIPLGFPFGFFVADNTPLDGKYGTFGVGGWRPYVDEAEVLAEIPIGVRHIGLTVNIDGVEWWFNPGTTDGDLVEKTSGGGGGEFWPLDGYGELTNDVEINGDVSFGVDFSSLTLFNVEANDITVEAVLGGISIMSAASLGVESDSFSFESVSTGAFQADDILFTGNVIKFAELSEDDTWVGLEYFTPPSVMTGNSIPYVDWVLDQITGGDFVFKTLTEDLTIEGNFNSTIEAKSIFLTNTQELSSITIGYIGRIDPEFAVGVGANGNVSAVIKQSDGKFIIGGAFSTYNGTSRNRIARINADGTLDTTFDPGTGFVGNVSSMALQSDGKIVVVGNFTSFNGTGKNRIVRLNADGSLDGTYTTGTGFSSGTSLYVIKYPNDDTMLVGNGGNYNGTSGFGKITKLNTDGTFDSTFKTNAGNGVNTGSINGLYLSNSGKIYIHGLFTTWAGVSQVNVVRINQDGTKDATFAVGTSFNGSVSGMTEYIDGRVIFVGSFTTYDGNAAVRIARLSSLGVYDATLVTGTGFTDGTPTLPLITKDEKIIVGGNYETYNSVTQKRFIRLNANGSKDTTFIVSTDPLDGVGSVSALLLLDNGQMLVTGNFSFWDGVARGSVVKLTNRSEITIEGDLVGKDNYTNSYVEYSYVQKIYVDKHTLTPYTVAKAPSPSTNSRSIIYVLDESGGAVPAFSDGTNWRRMTDRAIIS